jgi:sec-independent protein translocase protein TatC
MLWKKAPKKPFNPDEHRMTFGEHLEELRSRMIYALIGLTIASVFCWFFKTPILQIMMHPVQVVLTHMGQPPMLQALSPVDPFLVALKLAILVGLLISAPWILYQAWEFVGVGLYEKERRFVKLFLPASVILFYLGVFFLLRLALPIVINFFAGFSTNWPMGNLEPTWLERTLLSVNGEPASSQPAVQPAPLDIPILTAPPTNAAPGDSWFNPDTNEWCVRTSDGDFVLPLRKREGDSGVINQYSIRDYVSLVLLLSLSFGIAFQTPIVVVFLAFTGLVSLRAMTRARRFIYFGVFVVAAFLTPPDVVSQILLAIPMILLFELGLFAGKRVLRDRQPSAPAGG